MEGKVVRSVAYRALEVQTIYLEHKEDGIPDTYIFRKYIQPVYHISERTFRRYLARNARKEVRQIESHETSTLSS